jgi:signal transduction histidine kinase/DNA-binding response OmpR family regulator
MSINPLINAQKIDGYIVQKHDITLQKQAEREQIKEKMLFALSMSIKELVNDKNYYSAISNCIELLGKAIMVDGAFFFKNNYNESKIGFTSQISEWNSENYKPKTDKKFENIPFKQMRSIITPLERGRSVYGIVSQLKNDHIREFFETQGILTIALLPIFINNLFWGFIGFIECKFERTWTELEVSIMGTFINAFEKMISRSQMEEEIEISRKEAELANDTKSRFLANMSHEIRTPLNGMVGTIALLSRTAMTNKQKQYTEILDKSTQSLIYLINNILDLSKVEAGKMELLIAPFAIKSLINDTVNEMESIAKEKGIEITTMLSSKIPEYYYGDFEKIRQVLLNLLSNSIKFTRIGKIEIIVEDYTNDNLLKFSVKDTGIGIAKKNIIKIFEPFEQADNTITREFGGTGLGLSICKGIINLMGGDIWIESEEGVGTEVYFTVKVNEADDITLEKNSNYSLKNGYTTEGESEKAKRENKIIPRKNKKFNILIVEDNKINQIITSDILENNGHSYQVATNGNEAIELFKKSNFDVILMDLQMPQMDGYVTTSIIRKMEKGMNIPIVAITAYAMIGDREKCLQAGMNYYLTKPIMPNKLISLLNEIISKTPDEEKNSGNDTADIESAFVRMKSDIVFFSTIVGKFSEESREIINNIKQALANKDEKELNIQLHTLKGLIAIFKRKSANKFTKNLERIAEENDFEGAENIAEEIEKELQQLVSLLYDFIKEKTSP